ncbi:MAG: hypothetical protein HEQ23_04995 [Tepidisphaera sp.]|jgi:hypothetical protein
MKRRAFIMPLVLMLTMVLTLTAAFVLQRQGSQSMIQRRHMAQYESHHTTRGVADVIEAWLTGGGRYKSFRDRIDGDGKILDITVPDGLSVKSQGSDVLRISVKDAQGTLLSDFSGLTGQSFLDSKAALDALKEEAPTNWRSFTRTLGPTQVSLAEAKREVLSAIVQGITGSIHDGQEFVRSVMQLREQGPIDAQMLNQAVIDAGLPPEQQAQLNRMITSETTFWTLRVDVLRNGSLLVGRYEGYLLTTGPSRSAGQQGQNRRGHVMNLKWVPPA